MQRSRLRKSNSLPAALVGIKTWEYCLVQNDLFNLQIIKYHHALNAYSILCIILTKTYTTDYQNTPK